MSRIQQHPTRCGSDAPRPTFINARKESLTKNHLPPLPRNLSFVSFIPFRVETQVLRIDTLEDIRDTCLRIRQATLGCFSISDHRTCWKSPFEHKSARKRETRAYIFSPIPKSLPHNSSDMTEIKNSPKLFFFSFTKQPTTAWMKVKGIKIRYNRFFMSPARNTYTYIHIHTARVVYQT